MSSIALTIIIDRDGKVIRHFVAGGTLFAKDLDDALDEVTTAHPSKNDSLGGH